MWDKIREEFETSKITLKALAEKYDVKLGTLKSRKSRECWTRGSPKKDATISKKDATPKKKDATIKTQESKVFVESDDLTDKQRLFCIYYVKSFNATQSAIKAGYSPNSAHVEGSRLIRNPKVADEIRRLKGEMMQGVFVDAMDVLNKYIQIAFADITDFVEFGTMEKTEYDDQGKPILDKDGKIETRTVSFVDLKDYKTVDGTLITEVKQGRDGISVKLADKMKALEILSKYFDLLSENDQKRLKEEKLKAETAKVKAEVDKVLKENSDEDLEEIVIVNEWGDDDE